MAQWQNARLVWAPGMCISRRFPVHAHTAGVGAPLRTITNILRADGLIIKKKVSVDYRVPR